ncbi:MAG: PAS domain S-box protein [Candidatus Hodarchaeota archaeon]
MVYEGLHNTFPGEVYQMATSPQTEEWLDKIMDVVSEGLVVMQDEFIVKANTAFAEMIEYEKDELLDMPFEDIVDSLSRRHDRTMLDALIEGKSVTRFNTRLLAKNGDVLYVEVNPTCFELTDEPVVIASIRNISREIALETAVTELEQRFATLYDMSPIAYFTINREGFIEQVNQAAEELLGCGADEIIGYPLSDFLPDPEPGYDPGEEIIREVLRGKSVSNIEVEMLRKDDRTLWASVSSRALSSGLDRPAEIGLMAVDITWRRAAEERLRHESERANLYMEIMSSDLNEIYQSTLFEIEDLVASLDPPERERGILYNISRNLRRSARMIANMQVLLGLRETPPEKVKTDLYPHLKKAMKEADRDFETKELKLETNITDDAFEVVGHAFLWSIMFNIIHNSLKFSPKDEVEAEILAEYIDDGRQVRIDFCDKGPGIPDDMKTLIFRRAGTPESAKAAKGLGLTLVDRYVEDMGGQIWVEDRVPGKPMEGSRFVVILPAWKEKIRLPTITFWKSDHCVFCGPVLDMLSSILDELGVGRTVLNVVNIDDPGSPVTEDDLPALPTIDMGGNQLTGFVSEDDLRSTLMTMIMTQAG